MGYESLDSNITQRLSLYLQYFQTLPRNINTITPLEMANTLMLDQKVVRQDLKALLNKDRINKESRDELLEAISDYIGSKKVKSVVLVGVGKLGSALMSYAGFSVYDLDIMVGFDVNEKIIKKGVYGKPVYHISRIGEVCGRLNTKIGIITTPGQSAQDICDRLIKAGVIAIWNFTSARLNIPSDVFVQNEVMSASLRCLAEYVEKENDQALFNQ